MDAADLAPDPLAQFGVWFGEARAVGIRAPQAMALATATSDGRPSLRMVLLKGFDERGFVFFTGYESRKGGELAANPRAALLLYWDPPGRQVRIEGAVERTPRHESEAYFRSRPRGSQLAANASRRQSEAIESREELDRRFAELERELEGRAVPLPPAWGGFLLVPESYEFWEHSENRLHDRIHYRREGDRWRTERLSP